MQHRRAFFVFFTVPNNEIVTSSFCYSAVANTPFVRSLSRDSVDAYISGIVAGVLTGAGFSARVTAHSVALEEGERTANSNTSLPPRKDKAVFLVKFAPEVLERDAAMDR